MIIFKENIMTRPIEFGFGVVDINKAFFLYVEKSIYYYNK